MGQYLNWRIFFRLTAMAVLGCSIAGLLTPLFWFFDLFNPFRPQAFAAGLLLTGLALVRCERGLLLLAGLIVVLNGGLIGARLAQSAALRPPMPAQGAELTLLSSNVLIGNAESRPLLAQIAATQPDIVVAVEVSHRWARDLQPLERIYNWHEVVGRSDSFGIAVYSRRAFTATTIMAGMFKLPLLRCDFGDFVLLAVHPVSPMRRIDRVEQRAYIKVIAELAAAETRPLIVAGDFNSTLWSDSFTPLLDAGLAPIDTPLHYSWPSNFPPLAIQIDHIMARNGVTGTLSTLPYMGSDHFPLLSRLRLPAVSSAP